MQHSVPGMDLRLLASLGFALCFVSGCETTSWRTQALPREQIQPPRAQGPVDLELPPPDTVVAVQHPDGTPLWVVHRKDGTVSVFSALVSIGRANPQKVDVHWQPTLRRFTQVFAYDDRGMNLGRIECELCTEPPDSKLYLQAAKDLDTFEVERLPGPPERIRVGPLRPGATHPIPNQLLPEASEERREFAVPHGLSIAQALALPEGTTLSINATLVRASGEPPRFCENVDRDACCPANAPRLYDVEGIPLGSLGPMIVHQRLFLLRRYRDGFVQYDVGRALDRGHSHMTLPAPPDYDTWDFAKPPPRSICR
ncbi:hypothetical protein [Myxococcus landrumensis]|uniref:Lipoprotein n=1 Tax=Myxococcus landrumensis TaxID=2813577 RepID=A0ABX7N328_9BACT|nr:hypothetical protein [Myxococcus landrumus]QSQ13121.1 hypothetical protein JY572_32990 [Myxococcus landrumus]